MESPRVVVITGASAGVGRATARAFAKHGARIGLIARGREGLAATAAELRLEGAASLAIPCDVADAAQVEAAADRIAAELGPIDVWVNNAMLTVMAEVEATSPEEFRRVTEVTYLGYVHGTMAALKHMRQRSRGVIVQVGSALAYRGIPLQAAYCGAKHAVRGFTDSLRAELRQEKGDIRLVMVQLPAINTPQFSWALARLPREPQPVPPIYQPEVAAQAILWAAKHRRRELYVGSSTAASVLASRLFPGLVDRYLAATCYGSQMTADSLAPGRPHNLFRPIPADFGARGRFDAVARKRSLHLWLTTHIPFPAAVDGVVGAVAGLKMLLPAIPAILRGYARPEDLPEPTASFRDLAAASDSNESRTRRSRRTG